MVTAIRLRFLLAAAMMAAAFAIYPDDHWTHSTSLTESNFDSYIQEQIDAGKTTFAPAWNAVVKAFTANEDVAFGDVNLSENQIRGNHNPGAGGWPTIRYFNKETGIDGGTYQKKTSKSMCDELGDDEMMTAYVEEYGNTSLCSVIDGKGCNEKEQGYIKKMGSKTTDEVEKQLQRLSGMDPNDMKPELGDWLNRRKKILTGLLAGKDEL